MTVVTVLNIGGSPVGFNAVGHSGYAKHDYDIVCAGVSALTQSACMGIMQLVKADVDFSIKGGELHILLRDTANKEQRDKVELILGTMLLGLRSIEEKYSDYLKLCEREV